MKHPLFFVLPVFIVFYLSKNDLCAQDCDNPNSTFEFVGNVNTYFCEGPDGVVTVDITVDENNDPACIDHMLLDWGDGTVLTLGPADFGNYTHFYEFEDSLACGLSVEELNPEVKLTLYFKNGKLNKRTQSLAITPLPRGVIAPKGPYCVNAPVNFSITDSCYIDSVFWNFGNGNTSTLFNPSFTWNTTGIKTINLCVFNECGEDCSQTSINIIDKPDVSAISLSAVPNSGCIPLDVKFTATVAGVYDYDWSVISPSPCFGCYAFVPATGTDSVSPVIRFTKEGTYRVMLTGKNPCGQDTFSVVVQAYAPPNVSLAPLNPPGCKSLSFTPTVTYLNLNPGSITSYKWTFPQGNPAMSALPKPADIQYINNSDTLLTDIVTLTVIGPCDTQTYTTTVKVYGNTQVSFTQPPGQVCTGDEPFFIQVTPPPPVGSFSINPSSGALNTATGLLNPSLLTNGVTYTVTYTVSINDPGAPPDCESQDSISFPVLFSQTYSIVGPDKLCVDAPPLQLISNPATDGIWSAKGITDPMTGAYSPALAMPGIDTVQFSFTDALTGCVSNASKTIEIVGIPQVQPPDTIFTCHIQQGINLETLGTFAFNPVGGVKTWGGAGVNTQTGVFTSPGVGIYNLTLNYDINPACDTTVNFTVRVDSFVAAVAGPDVAVCQIQDSLTLSGWPGGGKWSGSPNIDSVTGTINLTAEIPGLHTYTYTIRAGTPCESSDMVEVDIVPGDGVSVNQPLDYVCETASTYTLPGASPPGGGWSGPFVSGNVVTVDSLDPGSYTYTYTAADLPDACNEATFTLVVAPQPSADFILMPDTACLGETIVILPATTTGVTYDVNWGDSNTGPALSHSYAVPGDFSVALNVSTQHPLSGSTLCSNNLSKNIHIITPPQLLQFGMDKDTGCAPLLVTFTNQSIVENGQYVWDFGNDSIFVGFEPGPIEFQQGTEEKTYTITLTVMNGCTTMAFSGTVTVLPQPQADFGITYLEPCSGGILEINNTSTGNPVNNVWTTSAAQQFNSFNPPPLQYFTGSQPLSVDITLTVSNQCGTDSVTKSVTVNPTDVIALINISDTTEVCVNDTVTLTSFSTPGAWIHWKSSDGNTFLQNPVKVSFSQEGIYKITLYAEGCGYDSMDMYVRVHPLPVLTVEHPQIICPGDTALFNVLTAAPGSLLYFGTGDSSNLKTAPYRYFQSGIYPLDAIAVSLAGCRNAWSGSIEVAPKPEAVADVPDSVCAHAPVLFNSLSANDLTCVWHFGDNNFDDACDTEYTYPEAGFYTASLTVISALGCRDTAFAPVYVRVTPSAVPMYQYLERCTPAEVLFTSQSVGATGLEWDFGDGTTALVSPVSKTYASGGIYQVRLIATNEGICSDTGEVAVELWQTPLFDFFIKENCIAAEGADLSLNTPSGNLPTVTGPGYQQDGNFHAGLAQGYYDVSIVSPEGCLNDTTVFIPKPLELLLQVAEDSFDIRLGETIRLDALVNQLGVQFEWEPGIWLENDTLAAPLATPFRDITYYVTATALNGCTKSDTVFVAVLVERDSGLYIPDVFTPNEDGVNDIFYVRSVNPSVDHIQDFRILDKHGEIVHYQENCPAEQIVYGWDGTFKGDKAEMGIYRWQLAVVYKDGEKAPKSGFLMLVR